MQEAPRLIYVDDTSPLISYKGSWDINGNKYSPANTLWGGPFENTLHALSGSGSFTFYFTGPTISVIGSFQDSTNASWTCYLDGNTLLSNNASLNLNNVELCSMKNIETTTTPSNLTVEASGTSDNPFLFDRIQYAPDASVVLDNATVVVDAFDDQIQYSPGWSTDGSISKQTSETTSFLNFEFVGTKLTWMTTLTSEATGNSLAQYSIDNGTLFPFRVAGQTSTAQIYNLVSFQTGDLSSGSHRLFVQYGTDNPNNSAPLRLDYFIIHNRTIPTFIPNATATSATSTNATPTSTPSHTTYARVSGKLSSGAVSGIVIGSLVGAALIIFGLIWVIRFIKRKSVADESLWQQPASYEGYTNGQDT